MSDWLGIIFEIVVFIIVVVLAYVATRVLYSFTYHKLEKTLSRGTAHLIGKGIQYGILFSVIAAAFYYILDFDLTPLIASLGIISIAVAFAAQQVAQNAMAGVLVSAIKPFEIDDYIEVGGTPATEWGRVKEITLTHTILRDKDGRFFSVPNAFFMSNKVINYTKSGLFKLKVDIYIVPSTFPSISVLEAIVREELANEKRVMPNISLEEKQLALDKLERNMRALFEKNVMSGDFSPKLELLDIQKDFVKIGIRLWIRDITQANDVMSTFKERLRIRFSKEGIQFAND